VNQPLTLGGKPRVYGKLFRHSPTIILSITT